MKKPIDLVFLWHMHQPDYRDYATGDFVLPWTYLHAIKDYTDMAYHLEQHPKMHAVINFVPILLDQIEDYVDQFATNTLRDPLLRLLAHPDMGSLSEEERQLAFDSCFRSNHPQMVAPYPVYQCLQDMFNLLQKDHDPALAYLSGQYIADVLTWYHLAWCGESVRHEYPLVKKLMAKAVGFTYEDRKQLLKLIGELMSDIIPRYRKLSESGQIEISTTPHYHPLAPLLIDLNSAAEAMPDAPLPQVASYPGGAARVAEHIVKAKKSHAVRFGDNPTGIWPAEGSISDDTLKVIATEGCRWIASGQTVLTNSLRQANLEHSDQGQYLYQPYQFKHGEETLSCFFRDDHLSDLIGFEYSRWNSQDAARHLAAKINEIAERGSSHESPIVSVVLDGENAWEHYSHNGYYFLDGLYAELENHVNIRTTTYNEYLNRIDSPEAELPALVAGSWVYGNFATWIGSTDKNRAWDLLCIAKQSYDTVMAEGNLSKAEQAAAEEQLCSCESSDWFWWFGEYNSAESVSSFDRLFRHNLRELYRLLKLPAPHSLSEPVSQGSTDAQENGSMRRASE
jgi:alpha-amylase/alpha-mannosidase (GH57 family)